MLTILHVCYSDNEGGADKAALRLCKAQRSIGINAKMLVVNKLTNHPFVQSVGPRWRKLEFKIKDRLVRKIVSLQPTSSPMLHSLNLFPSFLHRIINKSDADIVNLHWIAKEMISVSEIAKIQKPIVWTLHDSWAFCGAEHHPNGLQDENFVGGYQSACETLQLNRWTWHRKATAWKNTRFHIVAPSQWEASMARRSSLFKHQSIQTIPNPLNTDIFQPFSKAEARAFFNIPPEKKVILFGSLRSVEDKNKGLDLLIHALALFKERYLTEDTLAVIFGMKQSDETVDIDFPRQYVGKINDEKTMAMLYSAADVMIVPSRVENLPQTATEPLACGTPVVGFQIGGLPDIIRHKHNGYLAQPYNPYDLADGIDWVLNHPDHEMLSVNAREFAVNTFSEDKIASQYEKIYGCLIPEKIPVFSHPIAG